MSDLGEVRVVLGDVVEQIGSAYVRADLARASIADALAVLVELEGEHSESVVPPELRRADVEIERGLRLIREGATAVADIHARL